VCSVGGWPMTANGFQVRPLLIAEFSRCSVLSSSGTDFDLQKLPVIAGYVLGWGMKSSQTPGRNGELLSRSRHTHGRHGQKFRQPSVYAPCVTV